MERGWEAAENSTTSAKAARHGKGLDAFHFDNRDGNVTSGVDSMGLIRKGISRPSNTRSPIATYPFHPTSAMSCAWMLFSSRVR